jgi:hypothetical protein
MQAYCNMGHGIVFPTNAKKEQERTATTAIHGRMSAFHTRPGVYACAPGAIHAREGKLGNARHGMAARHGGRGVARARALRLEIGKPTI